MIPKVKKNMTPTSPIPLTPPVYAIPKENKVIDMIRTKLRVVRIFLIFLFMLIISFRRDGWARPWPVGLEMLCYMLSHEAHHRGQVCMLAHQLGFPLPIKVTSGIWNWEKLWKE